MVLSARTAAAAAALCVALLATSCAAGEKSSGAEPAPASAAHGEDYQLYTHCGIRTLKFDGRWYYRVGGPLDDGSGNPPPGWGNPYQAGLLAKSPDGVVFTDNAGHQETFETRAQSTPPPPCS